MQLWPPFYIHSSNRDTFLPVQKNPSYFLKIDGSGGEKVSWPNPKLANSLPGDSALTTGKSKSHAVTNLLFLQSPRGWLNVPAEEATPAFSFYFILLECAGRIFKKFIWKQPSQVKFA